MMPGVPHHQGSASLNKYKKTYEAAHGGQPIGQLTAYALAHQGRAKADIQYNPDAGPEAYTNSTIHPRLTVYTEVARSVRGPEYDPRTEENLDPELVMRVGHGKQHERFMIGNSLLNTGSTPPLNRLRQRSTSSCSSVPIGQRPTVVEALQAEVQQLRAEQEAERVEREAERAEREVERAEREAERQRTQALEARHEGFLKFMQQLGEQQGWEILAQLLAPPPPPPPHHRESTPHQSGAASNHVEGSPASHVGPSAPGPSPGSNAGASLPSPASHVGPSP